MKLLETKTEVVEQKSYPGLFEAKFVHKIKETSASFNYIGPKFSEEMWDEILAFFKWSYAKTRGETQVRLFVHPQQGWKAWAFPQEASSGLSTTELPDNPMTKEQNAVLQADPEWQLYGTVHHHCSAGAFQSGTDKDNERMQEGIHITVGHIDKDVHSIDARFYYKGCKFQPDLSEFWDVGDAVKTKRDELQDYFGIKLPLAQIAEAQMCQTCSKDQKFPDQWQANLIEKVWPRANTNDIVYNGRPGFNGGSSFVDDPGYQGYPSKAIKMLRKYFRALYRADNEVPKGTALTAAQRDDADKDMEDVLDQIMEDNDIMAVIYAMQEHTIRNCAAQ